MRLSLFTDYSFRMLIHVAARDPELVTISEVSQGYGIARNHLTKIAHELGRAGYLETIRGRNGGMRLAKPATEIGLGEIMRLGEGASPLVECFDPATNRCIITPACHLKHLLADACESFYANLDQHTLAEIVTRPKELLSLLEAPSPV
jgi:Rrf2 family nitric oxide-sensitive transcriptional repressor